MKVLVSFLLLVLCTERITVLSQTSITTTASPDTTTASTDTTVTDTTTVASTTPTTPPETTTSPRTTATPETSSQTTVTPSTTGQPVTTSTRFPVTTTAFPEPEKCSWNVTQERVTCIRAVLKAQFTIPNEGKKSLLNVGCASSVSQSDCSSNDTQRLVLIENGQYNLTFVFEKDGDKVFVSNITLDYVLPTGNGSVANNDKQFNMKFGNSYLCRSASTIHLENVTMEISEIHIQAFGAKNNEDFASADECEADDKVSDIVPIAVGVALAALIIVVLIAYLVGRRRSRQRGYQSV